MTISQFDAPGFLSDVTGPAIKLWSDLISKQLDDARNSDETSGGLLNDGPRLQFFNPLSQPPAADAVELEITWTAFPRIVKISSVSDRQRWRTADGSRDLQDEYCEWSIERDPSSDKIVRVTFTSEGPEYWDFLAHQAPQTVLSLYQQHVSPEVKQSDLFDSSGKYNRTNRWNSSTRFGAMHLIQENNSLNAEIELAAAATIVRVRNGQPLTTEPELIACSRYGNPDRNSDPHIGAAVNALARAKDDVTLANPIGLYIAGLSVDGWKTPDGSSALDYWKVTRGTKEKALRAVFEVPLNKGFTVGDIEISGKKIDFGSQIADFITIKLTGMATRRGQSQVKPFDVCAAPVSATRAAGPLAFEKRQLRSHR
jgi:hypothetical protein